MKKPVIIVSRPSDFAGGDRLYRIRAGCEYLAERDQQKSDDDIAINLCRSYRYGSLGYHCSLLAEARGQIALPPVEAIVDLSSKATYRFTLPELDALLRKALRRAGEAPLLSEPLRGLDIFFGQVSDQRFRELARRVFDLFRCPILRLNFVGSAGAGDLRIAAIRLLSIRDLDAARRESFVRALESYLKSHRPMPQRDPPPRYDLAILHDPTEPTPPSSPGALRKFIQAGKSLGVRVELIGKKDFQRIAEFDALFIRETTRTNHHTYRFARRAAAAGLPVIDDPRSITLCTNKVFLADLLRANGVPAPQSVILDRSRLASVEQELDYPIVLKIPDGSFSRGVYKAQDRVELRQLTDRLFAQSQILLAQRYVPTTFDWRVGILNRQPLFVCQYFMTRNHWQVNKLLKNGRLWTGSARTFLVEDAPAEVLQVALQAANLIGDGLYGVDLKETPDGLFIIEINDNPNIDIDVEDACLRDEIYRCVMREFVRRIEAREVSASAFSPAPDVARIEPVRAAPVARRALAPIAAVAAGSGSDHQSWSAWIGGLPKLGAAAEEDS